MKAMFILSILLMSLTAYGQSDYFVKRKNSFSPDLIILTPSKCDGFLEGRKAAEVIVYDDVMIQIPSALFRSYFSEDKLKEIARLEAKKSGSMYWYVDSDTGEVLSVRYSLPEELYEFMIENDLIGLTEKFLSYKFDMSKVEVLKRGGDKGYWQFSIRFRMLISGKRKRDS